MQIKIDRYWVNPKYVVRPEEFPQFVRVLTADKSTSGGFDIIKNDGNEGITADLVALYLNESECGPTRSWEQFLEQERGSALSEDQHDTGLDELELLEIDEFVDRFPKSAKECKHAREGIELSLGRKHYMQCKDCWRITRVY